MQENHAKGSVPACNLSDRIFAAPVHKGRPLRSHEMSFNELGSAEEDGSNEANVRRVQKEHPDSYKHEYELLCNSTDVGSMF